jgi:predicted CoA-binding protein
LPSVRGKQAVAALKAMAKEMLASGAKMLWGQTPIVNRAAIKMNRLIGSVSKGFVNRAGDGKCELFVLERV